MANQKITITAIYKNNSPVPTSVNETVDTEVIENQVVARRDIINPGVISSAN